MKTLEIRNKIIGTGRPKTIVPIVAPTADAILAQAKELSCAPLDFVEWRADWWQKVDDAAALGSLLPALRAALGDVALLVTYRRRIEGGEGDADLAAYIAFCEQVIATGCADLLDVELSVGAAPFAKLTAAAHAKSLPIIASSHNFALTPPADEMVSTLCEMQRSGADIAKLAVMPNSRGDLLHLLSATATMADQHPQTPIVTMSMGAIGQASRVCGASFGSAMTFASIGTASAPGQIALPEMNQLLDALYGEA